MKTIGTVVAALALACGAISIQGTVQAQPPALYFRPELRPDIVPQPQVIRLGFRGHFDVGEGMHVEEVIHGSLADRLGIEPGDIIVGINGRRLRTEADYFRLLATTGTRIRVAIEDVRTGRLIERSIRLPLPCQHDHGHEPIVPGLPVPPPVSLDG